MSDTKFTCGRRGSFEAQNTDFWRESGTCSHCGSLSGDKLMEMLEAGTCELGSTDKSYRVYVEGVPNPRVGQKRVVSIANHKASESYVPFTVAEHAAIAAQSGWVSPVEGKSWVMVRDEPETITAKFYFQHWTEAQMRRSIELYNDKKIKFRGVGFYVSPYFMAPI